LQFHSPTRRRRHRPPRVRTRRGVSSSCSPLFLTPSDDPDRRENETNTSSPSLTEQDLTKITQSFDASAAATHDSSMTDKARDFCWRRKERYQAAKQDVRSRSILIQTAESLLARLPCRHGRRGDVGVIRVIGTGKFDETGRRAREAANCRRGCRRDVSRHGRGVLFSAAKQLVSGWKSVITMPSTPFFRALVTVPCFVAASMPHKQTRHGVGCIASCGWLEITEEPSHFWAALFLFNCVDSHASYTE